MQKLVAILMVSTSLAACGGSSSSPSDSSPIALADAPRELAKAFCAAEKDCSPFYYSIGFANTDCTASLTKQFQQATFDQIQTAIDAKTVKYDGGLARECATALSAGSCGTLDNNSPDVCQKALAGTVAMGGDCNIDAECSGLSRCDITGATCPGKCAARASAGVACAKDSDCALGLTCSTATAHCAAPAASGEACKGTTAGECAAGLLCVGNDDGAKREGKCMTEAETLTMHRGDTCDLQKGPWCTAGLACVVDSASLAGLVSTCHELAMAGGDCGFGIPSQCPTGQACPLQLSDLATGTYTAKCTALPGQADACGSALGLARCAADLICDDVTAPLKPVCITPHDLGESCSGNAVCYSQHCVGNACVPESACAK
ncbi:MAG TPA: hypothetical protein VF294_00090 [Polyangiaceae bacterium]